MDWRLRLDRLHLAMAKVIHLRRFQEWATVLPSFAPETIVDLACRFFLHPATATAMAARLSVVVPDREMVRDFRQLAVVAFFAGRSSPALGPFDLVPFQTGSVTAIVAAADLVFGLAAAAGSVDPAIGRSVSSAAEVAALAFLLDVFLVARSSL